MALVHRLLAGTHRGPKKRVHNVARTVPPTQVEWNDLLASPGVQGGLDVRAVNMERHLEQRQKEVHDLNDTPPAI